jgi:hypothetical protein
LHQYDYDALNCLCGVYNTLRAEVISSQEQPQELVVDVEAHAQEVAVAIEQLRLLKLDLTECIRLAQEEIKARGETFINTVMYIPMHRRYLGNTNSYSRSFFSLLIYFLVSAGVPV